MVIDNIRVFGLEDSIRESKYPMSVNISNLTDELTDNVKNLGRSKIGSGHDNFLNGILIKFDLTLSIKAWVEAERYHFLEFVSSQSTMHRISKMNFDECCNEYVTENTKNEIERLKEIYNQTGHLHDYLTLLYNVPTGFKLTAAMTTNYRQLKTIYYQRKNHRLPEWQEFCNQVEELPMFKELVIGESNG